MFKTGRQKSGRKATWPLNSYPYLYILKIKPAACANAQVILNLRARWLYNMIYAIIHLGLTPNLLRNVDPLVGVLKSTSGSVFAGSCAIKNFTSEEQPRVLWVSQLPVPISSCETWQSNFSCLAQEGNACLPTLLLSNVFRINNYWLIGWDILEYQQKDLSDKSLMCSAFQKWWVRWSAGRLWQAVSRDRGLCDVPNVSQCASFEHVKCRRLTVKCVQNRQAVRTMKREAWKWISVQWQIPLTAFLKAMHEGIPIVLALQPMMP